MAKTKEVKDRVERERDSVLKKAREFWPSIADEKIENCDLAKRCRFLHHQMLLSGTNVPLKTIIAVLCEEFGQDERTS